MGNNYYLENESFIIEDYDRQKPFASFLPGIAGIDGIPMWVYYTNRGQGIAGFGVENKDGSMLDFVPANMSYRRTENAGFRTFIKKEGKVHELFTPLSMDDVKRKMIIDSNSVGFVEENKSLDLKVSVKFFTTTRERFPGLIRKLTIESLSGQASQVEVLDGLMTLWPYGTTHEAIKEMSNLMTAWFETYNGDNNLPFYRNRATSDDSAEVGVIEAGHFYGAFLQGHTDPLPVFYDPDVLFGNNTGNTKPWAFEENSLKDLLQVEQVSANKIPCAFTGANLLVDQPLVMHSIVGKMNHIDSLNAWAANLDGNFFSQQESLAYTLAKDLVDDVKGKTAYPMFDAYVKQSYFDNFLRGGYPLVFEGKNGPIVYHVYSRIHGDMEREYNEFLVEPAYYSQGIGNFRDVNQNRRNDIFIEPEAGKFNIKQFMEFIQLDGQNPLSIRGSELRVRKADRMMILDMVKSQSQVVSSIISKPFTPGKLMTAIDDYQVSLSLDRDEFLTRVMKCATQEINAAYGHGFWVDHWTYNMDLVDNYLNIYPEKLSQLLYEEELRYFVSPAQVLAREDKFVITSDGRVRQYDAVIIDQERVEKLGLNMDGSNWLKTLGGEIYTSSLFVKLYALVMNKVVNMDPSGIGIMMNTDKPGWNDAMNGLPGLFGSGSSEVVELNRIVSLLKQGMTGESIQVPMELKVLVDGYIHALEIYETDGDNLKLYETAQDLKEAFDQAIAYGIKGQLASIKAADLAKQLDMINRRLDQAVAKAKDLGQGILPSYFIHEALDYKLIPNKKHPVNAMQNVKVTSWSYRALPLYLEAPARYLKQVHDPLVAKPMYDKIKKSGMYDEKLAMYVTSESLEDESMEIGRARAFVPGWLERESVFMHMEYKYMLGMLKSELYDEFFETIKTALPPFMDPKVYGRSTLENSSFIASSRNPNPSNHGRGFVSRLTGTTSELITMWLLMMTGMKLFTYHEGSLRFQLKPSLSSDFFNEDNQVECTIFKNTAIVYHNPLRKRTYGQDQAVIEAYQLTYKDGKTKKLKEVVGQDAKDIRQLKVSRIDVYLT